jgi:hypothetical protein
MTDSPATPSTAGGAGYSPATTGPSGADSSASVEETRRKLEETLDAIEEKLDVKKRASEVGDRVQRSYAENPVPWIIGATAVAVGIIGLVAWAIFSDD